MCELIDLQVKHEEIDNCLKSFSKNYYIKETLTSEDAESFKQSILTSDSNFLHGYNLNRDEMDIFRSIMHNGQS